LRIANAVVYKVKVERRERTPQQRGKPRIEGAFHGGHFAGSTVALSF